MNLLKKNVSLLMVLSVFATTTIPQNVQAYALEDFKADSRPAQKRLAEIFNKFRYDMTVEWDQRDPFFRDHAQKELEIALASLKSEGVSDKEIQSYMEKNLLDAKVKKDYQDLLAAMKDQNLSSEEAKVHAMKFMEKNYREGTSFAGGGSTGSGAVVAIVAIIIIGVVTFIIIKGGKKPHHDGSNGQDGSDGYDGSDGSDGSDGHNGWDGSNGSDGMNGWNGSNGHNGSNGSNGYNGSNGWNGSNGSNGSSGWNGYNGYNGSFPVAI